MNKIEEITGPQIAVIARRRGPIVVWFDGGDDTDGPFSDDFAETMHRFANALAATTTVYRLDTAKWPKQADEHSIFATPTLVLWADGERKAEHCGDEALSELLQWRHHALSHRPPPAGSYAQKLRDWMEADFPAGGMEA